MCLLFEYLNTHELSNYRSVYIIIFVGGLFILMLKNDMCPTLYYQILPCALTSYLFWCRKPPMHIWNTEHRCVDVARFLKIITRYIYEKYLKVSNIQCYYLNLIWYTLDASIAIILNIDVTCLCGGVFESRGGEFAINLMNIFTHLHILVHVIKVFFVHLLICLWYIINSLTSY